MAFNAGDLVATIRLDGVDRFNRDARTAGESLQRTAQVGDRVGKALSNAFGVAATGTVAAGAAATAYVSTLFRTGAAYNTLQQTSRAALKTLLGSTEAVNNQMAQLDDFARNSPFSKATFIQAQQQLLGFGIEASKVIPILGAVQDATAAVGGSNQQISEIVSILAKISSSGKITAEDLNQLGERGLDAATLLGQGFGKSAADIRKDITDGAIDAGKAIDVLTEQMTTKFGGAAANVKTTWAGAVDRIKAAQREIGATLAEPFISQQGGGMAVIWGNQVADVMRAVLVHTQPVVTIMGDRLAPAFAAFTRGLDEARVIVKAWDSARLESFLNQADQYGPAIAVLAGAIAGFTGRMAAGIPILGAFTGGLTPLSGALTAAALASPEVRAALADVLAVLRPLGPVVEDLANVGMAALNDALPVAADLIRLVADVARPLVQVIGSLPTPVVASVAAFLAMRSALKGLDLQRVIDGFRRIGEQMAVQRALATMEGVTVRAGGAFAVAGTKATGFANSLKAMFIGNPVGLAITGISLAVTAVVAALAAQEQQSAATKQAIADYRETLVDTTGALTDATTAAIENKLAEEGVFDAGKKLGLSKQTLIDAVRGEAAALALVKEAYAEHAGVVQKDGITQAKQFNTEAGVVNSTVLEQVRALEEAQEQTRRDAEEKRRAIAAMTEFERSNNRIETALSILRDTTSDATEKLSALKQILDELNGQTLSTEDAQQQLNDQVRSLADAFAQTDEQGNKLIGSLVDGAGKIDTTTAAGSRLRDQVMGMRDAMLDAVLAADAQAKANGDAGVSVDTTRAIVEEYSQKLREQAEAAGLSEEQIAGLVAQMDETPEVLAFAVTDEGTIDANQLRLIDLATQIRDTPDGHFEVREDDIPGLMEALRLLGVDIRTLPVGTVKVQRDDGSFYTVENGLNELARTRTAMIRAQFDAIVRNGAPAPAGSLDYQGRNGMLPGFMDGEAFANGGGKVHRSLPTGIYAGRPASIYKFAEMETRWEAFISGKAGQEARNRRIAAEAVRRLGGVASFERGSEAVAFANGAIAQRAAARIPELRVAAPARRERPAVASAAAPAVSAPLIGGDVTFVSSGNPREDWNEFEHELRRLRRGGGGSRA